MRPRLFPMIGSFILAAAAGCGGGGSKGTAASAPACSTVWVTHGPDEWHNRTDRGQPIDLSPYVSTNPATGSFALVAPGTAAPLVVSAGDFPGVVRVVNDLSADVSAVTGVTPAIAQDMVPASTSGVVLIGTLGKSPIIDGLVKAGKLDVSAVSGKWETWLTQVIEAPMDGVAQALVIAGSDQRGTIYGAYDLSRQIGVSPWSFWDDVPAPHRDTLYVLPGAHTLGQPAVKYRGFFINDENPALGTWAPQYFGPGLASGFASGFNHEFYARVFEVMLRLRANYLWPAVWGRAFDLDDPASHALAKQYGVVMGTSHEAPMDRGIEEWNRKPNAYGGNGQWSFRQNPDAIKKYWNDGIKRMMDGGFEDVVTIGMRGNGDTALPDGQSGPLMTDIINTERCTLGTVSGKDASTIPQVWTLYKEVQATWDGGLRAPSDVTINWCDDNWGDFRELPDQTEAQRGGGYGLYYHYDYVGGGRDYKWVDTNLLPNVWEQLHLAYTYGVDRLWMVNVGDMKNEELPLQFFLDYAWSPESWPVDKLPAWEQMYAEQQFGPDHAMEIAEVLHGYARLQARRKPELLNRVITRYANGDVSYADGSAFSLTDYREAERVVDEWQALAVQAQSIAANLPQNAQDAYYELVLYEVQATSNLYQLRLAEFKNILYAAQGRAATADMADLANARWSDDQAMSTYYNQTLASGKWQGFQTQTKLGYGGDYADSSWQAPDGADFLWPPLQTITIPAGASMGVAIDGSDKAWPAETTAAVLPTFSPFQSQPQQYIEVFNLGTGSFTYTITPQVPWMTVTPNSGTIDDATKEVRALVSVDWSMAPAGTTNVGIAVAANGTTVNVGAVADKPQAAPTPNAFVEANGYVSMEAEHFSRKVETSSIAWQLIPDIGRTGSGLTPFPPSAARQTPGGDTPRLEYDMHLFTSGPSVVVWVYLSPRNNVLHSDGLKYAISIDDATPQIVNVTAKLGADPTAMNQKWEAMTSDNVALTSTTHPIAAPNLHVLKLWMVDPTVVVQKLVVDTGGLKTSYLGPPESLRTPPQP